MLEDTVRVMLRDELATVILPRLSNSGSTAQWVSAGVSGFAFALAVISGWLAYRRWRLDYLTSEWSKTIHFIFAHPEFLDADANRQYRVSHQGKELHRYELVARLSIAFLDDLYHLRMRGHLENWLKGSVDIFLRPHYQWFNDHTEFYSDGFVEDMRRRMNQLEAPSKP